MPQIRHKVLNQTISYRILTPLSNGTRPLDMDDAWEAANIVKVTVPQLRGVDDGTSGGSTGVIRFHKAGAAQLLAAFAEIEQRGLKHLILSFAGSYYPRMIRGSTSSPSEHSFGTALDINAGWNGLAKTPAPRGAKGSVVELVPIFEKHGFRWGGYFSRPDGMHFELARLIADAVPIAKARSLSINNGKQIRLIPNARLENGYYLAPVREIIDAMNFDFTTDEAHTTPDKFVLNVYKPKG